MSDNIPTNPEEFAALFARTRKKADRRVLAERFYDAIAGQYTLATVAGCLYHVRMAITNLGRNDVLLRTESKGGVVPDDLYVRLKRHANQRVWNEHNNMQVLNAAEFVAQTRTIFDEMEQNRFVASVNKYRLAAALLAATGRRSIEILKLGWFEAIPYKKYQLWFAGQAKTRNREGTHQAFVIPTLIPAKRVLEAFFKMRMQFPETQTMENEDVSFAHHARLSEEAKKAFGMGFTPHKLRSAYAAICYAQYARERRISAVAYYSRILGHKLLERDEEGGDLNTPLSYFDFQVIDDPSWKPRPGAILKRRGIVVEKPPMAVPPPSVKI